MPQLYELSHFKIAKGASHGNMFITVILHTYIYIYEYAVCHITMYMRRILKIFSSFITKDIESSYYKYIIVLFMLWGRSQTPFARRGRSKNVHFLSTFIP